MITNTGKELCPYFSEGEREKWHRERGIEDPLKGKKFIPNPAYEKAELEVEPPLASAVVDPPMPGEETIKEPDGMTKEQRYRARNKEKLAARARERRAAK